MSDVTILPVKCPNCAFEAELKMVGQAPGILRPYSSENYMALCIVAKAEHGGSTAVSCRHFRKEARKVVAAFRRRLPTR
jgi:hypothetical protein